MGIKAVVFDFGKVICYPPDDSAMDKIAVIAGVRRDLFEPFFWKLRKIYDNGELTGMEYMKNIFREVNIHLDDEKLSEIWEIDKKSWTNINPHTEKLMTEVKNAGYILGILSNMPFDFLDHIRENLPVISLAHIGIYSCDLGSGKPEKKIYEKLLEEINRLAGSECRPQEVVFFDDMPENVEGAKKLNINGIVWKDCDDARLNLTRLGVQL